MNGAKINALAIFPFPGDWLSSHCISSGLIAEGTSRRQLHFSRRRLFGSALREGTFFILQI